MTKEKAQPENLQCSSVGDHREDGTGDKEEEEVAAAVDSEDGEEEAARKKLVAAVEAELEVEVSTSVERRRS